MAHKFWKLSYPKSTASLAEWDDSMDLEQILCPADPDHRRGGRRLSNLSVLLRGHPGDIVWTWYSDCLLNDRALQAFTDEGLTGFTVKPVAARFKRKVCQAPPRLWELVVTGWAGVAPAASGVRLIFQCPACGDVRYSPPTHPDRLVDEGQWDGSDFFIVWPLPKYRFVTERVAQVLRRYRLKGARLIEPAEMEFVAAPVGGDRLSEHMPEARARELGEPLGIY
jgi:hypothetical protein